MGNLGSLAMVLFFAAHAGAWAASAVVNSETDAPDPVPGDGICDTGFGPSDFTGICTLRAALQTAQAGDQITFAPGIQRIFINFDMGSLVSLRGSIDGGPGKVEITSDGRGAYAITVNPAAAGTNPITIRNLIINGFAGDGIQVISNLSFVPTNTTIENCFIGTDRTGLIARGNGADGIIISRTLNTVVRDCILSANGRHGIGVFGTLSGDDLGTTIIGCKIGTDITGSVALPNGGNGVNLGNTFINPSATRVGGILPGEGNVISGNMGHGIYIAGQDFPGDFLVRGNFIGTDALGGYAIPNGLDGIALDRTDDAIIGGPTPAERNVISGNGGHGISVGNAFSDNHRIQGNFIGSDVSGELPVANALHGIFIHSGALNVVVGERQADAVAGVATGELGPGNLIAFNGGSGIVSVQAANQGNFRRNRIHSNGEIGIDLGGDGPTPNGTPSGVNFNMPFPVINSTATGGLTTITGTVNGFGGVSVVDFYRSDLCDPSGYGEGGVYLGTILPATNNFVFEIPGEFLDVTATMTSSMATSELSPCGELMVVNTTGDASDDNPGDGACSTGVTIPGGAFECTLRAAIEEANADAEPEVIQFQIKDGGPDLVIYPRISPGSALPAVMHPVTIDATTQGSPILEPKPAQAAPDPDDPLPSVLLDGAAAGPGASGIVLAANYCSVRGFAIVEFGAHCVEMQGSECAISGCHIGTDPLAPGRAPKYRRDQAPGGQDRKALVVTGSKNTIGGAGPDAKNVIQNGIGRGVEIFGPGAVENRVIGNSIRVSEGDGIRISGGAARNQIGGPCEELGRPPGNRISGNSGDGISIREGSAMNVVQGNLIGTEYTGTGRFGNSDSGIEIRDSPGNKIGGRDARERNVIAGNHDNGIFIRGFDSQMNVVEGNFIGLDVDKKRLGNDDKGIFILDARKNTIGGTEPGSANIISDNGNAGILVANGPGNAIFGNSIYANASKFQKPIGPPLGLGIDLSRLGKKAEDGATPNDAGDGDPAGNEHNSNGLQNFPVLTAANGAAGTLTIAGTLASKPNRVYRIEFFGNDAIHASRHGEGREFYGFTNVTTGGDGNANIGANFPEKQFPDRWITATATDLTSGPELNNTSEFSMAFKVARNDADGDGVDDATENANPGTGGGRPGRFAAGVGAPGDGNDDGIQDSAQPNVASFPDAVERRYVTIESPPNTALANVEPALPHAAPDSLDFPFGLFSFEFSGAGLLAGGAAEAKLYLPEADLTGFTYYKFAPSPGAPSPHWFEFAFDGARGAEFGAGVVTLNFIDGDLGDADAATDARISDPGGPAIFDPSQNSAFDWRLYR